MLNLANLYNEDGYKNEAYEWFKKAANAGNKDAKDIIAKTYEKAQIKSTKVYSAIENKVFNIIADQLGLDIDDIHLDDTFVDDLGADSLDIAELIMRFEYEFGIEIPDEKAEKIETVDDAIKYVKYNQ